MTRTSSDTRTTRAPRTQGRGSRTAPTVKLAPKNLGTVGDRTIDVAIADLHYDENYQRAVIPAQVNKIIREFDPEKFTPPIVVARTRNGGTTYWVIDGRQRLAAAERQGYTRTRVIVRGGRSIQREAELFAQFNLSPKRLSPQDIYKANLVYGEQVSMAIEATLAGHRLTGMHAAQSDRGEIHAIATLREAFGDPAPRIGATLDTSNLQYGQQTLDWALTIGEPLLNKGESAHRVYSRNNLAALIWTYRNAVNQKILGRTSTITRLQKILANTTATHMKEVATAIKGSAGGSQRAVWGLRLSKWLNEQAGGKNPVIELSPDTWAILDKENARHIA